MVDTMKQDSHLNCKTNDEWQFRRGQLEVLTYLMGYEDLMKSAYEELSKPQ